MIESIIHWDVSPEIFSFGFISIRWYSLLFALGFIVGYQIMSKIFLIENKTQKDLDSLTIVMIISTVIGARLGHCLFYDPEFYLSNPIEILKIWRGGLASHGAVIGILLGLWIFVRKRKGRFTFLWVLDRIAVVTALAGCFIRLGNFFNSEMIGLPTDLPWAIVFEKYDSVPRHPGQLYEALAYLVVFLVLYFRYQAMKSKTPPGQLIGLFFLLIFIARFFIEFVKIDQVPFEAGLPLNMGQILSLPLILIGIYLVVRSLSIQKSAESPRK